MNIDYLGEIAKQGFGYLLFAGAILVVYFLYKENQKLNKEKVDLANQRVDDLKEAKDAYATLSSQTSKTAENTLSIVQNIQQILNSWKKV